MLSAKKHISILVLTIVMVSSSCSYLRHPEKPNVLIIITDEQGWGDIGFNGNQVIETPNIDNLAKNAAVFNRFYVSPSGPVTRAGILTGKYYFDVYNKSLNINETIIDSSDILISELLKQNNYNTAYFGKWENGTNTKDSPLNNGFDYFLGFTSKQPYSFFNPKLIHNNNQINAQGYIADIITDSLKSFITKQNKSFLAVLSFNSAHDTTQIPYAYYSKYTKKGLDTKTSVAYGLFENIDYNVGRIVNTLKQVNKLNNTIIIYTSDNGTNYVRYNGGLKGRKGMVDEGGVRVPCFFAYKNCKWDNNQNNFITNIDLYKTICQACNVNASMVKTDGIGFYNVLTGKQINIEPNQYFTNHIIDTNGNQAGSVRYLSYILTINIGDTCLYNIVDDPFQKNNIIDKESNLTKKLITDYHYWLTNTKN